MGILLHLILLAFGITTLLALAVQAYNARYLPGARSIFVFIMSLAVWALAYFAVFLNPVVEIYLPEVANICMTIAAMALFVFTLVYTRRDGFLSKTNIGLLVLAPTIIWVFYWAHKIINSFSVNSSILVSWQNWLITIYILGLLLISVALIVDAFIRSSLLYRQQSGLLLVGSMAPLMVSLLIISGVITEYHSELVFISYCVSGLMIFFAIRFYRMMDVLPIPRELVIECMGDGWMLLDKNDRVLDLNIVAENAIGKPRHEIFGTHIEKILQNWSSLQNQAKTAENKGHESQKSINLGGSWRYLNFRISPLFDRSGRPIGRVVIWRDITNSKIADAARQKSQNETNALIHNISDAASRAIRLEDFLFEVVFQLTYSFKGHSCCVYLIEDHKDSPNSMPDIWLTAQYGFDEQSVFEMRNISSESELINSVLLEKKNLLLKDFHEESKLHDLLLKNGASHAIFSPIASGENVQGLLLITRNEQMPFSVDEIGRITYVATELATYIQNGRERLTTIALSERQRLVRDLHDSVTQKLYGLLALTEAAKAAYAADKFDDPEKTLTTIGDNARQALKEMRLFLYELQPADIENQGLVAVLHNRLAAVEGRADIRARLIADDELSMPVSKQISLYYIAQEALNNVLRHASAQNVTVRIKQSGEEILMEIEDDGCGFVVDNTDGGGMGMKNMRERAIQAGGRLEIFSAPGHGTKVSVMLSDQFEASKLEFLG